MKNLCIAALAVLTLWACGPKKNEDKPVATADSVAAPPKNIKVTAKGPKPEWAPDIDDEMLAVIEKLDSYGATPIEQLTPSDARKNPTPADAVKDLIQENNIQAPRPRVDTVGKNIPVKGGEIHLRVYTPVEPKNNYPVVMYIHGGGWVLATIDTYDASAATISEQAEAVVVSVEYRKGPEHKFPTAHNDVYAAYRWIINNINEIKGDSTRIGLLGESAGGNLALNVAIKARDEKVHMPVSTVLVYPIAQSDMNTASYKKYANAKPLNKAMMGWFVKNALPSPNTIKDPRIDLTKAKLKGLPPTTIITAEIDPLMSDGEVLRDKLKDAGVEVNYQLYKGVTHEFFGMSAIVPDAKDAQKFAVGKLFK